MAEASTILGYAGACLAIALAVFVLRVGRGTAVERILVGLLVFEAVQQASFSTAGAIPGRWEEAWVSVALWSSAVLVALYLFFLSRLDTPLVAWVRGAAATRSILLAFVALPTLALAASLWYIGRAEFAPGGENLAIIPLVIGILAFAITCLYALVAAISVLRRAPPGPRRAQARAYVVAFGARDTLFFASIAANFLAGVAIPGVGITEPRIVEFSGIAGSLATVLFVPLLAYGLLKTQLFDVDLRIKVGIRRSTVVTVMLVVALAAAKTAEFYLNRTYGWIAGGVAAGAMLVLAPRLNKVGEKVANVAMPQVQPTATYLAAKKLDVYRTAVETAIETGGIDARQRLTLDRLRAKLALAADDCAAVEVEVTATAPLPASGS